MNENTKEIIGIGASIIGLIILLVLAVDGFYKMYDCSHNRHGIFVRGFSEVYCIEEGKH